VEIYHDIGATLVNVGKIDVSNVYDFTALPFKFDGTRTRHTISELSQLVGRFPDSATTLVYPSQRVDDNVFLHVPDTMFTMGRAEVPVDSDTQKIIHFVPPCPEFGGFPITYGEAWSYTTTSYETTYVNRNPIQNRAYTWSNSIVIDGYGLLRIPGYEFQCLRAKGVAGSRKVFAFITREGAIFVVNAPATQADTGYINASGYMYILGSSIVDDVGDRIYLPTGFALYQNFPNPFNPATTITYYLPRQSNVTLKVFDILGREIATLVNRVEEPGHKSVMFDASRLSGGVYFYRLQADNYVAMKKLLLIR
jgi:hypothetical protein